MVGITSTQQGAKFFVCATPQTGLPLTQSEFEALTYVEVGNVGNVGETGADTNIVSYDTHATQVTQKGKGVTDAGKPEIEVARVFDDPGQIIMRAAALTKYNYAFKREMADAPASGYTNTIYYNAGIVTGPKRSNGKNEDFDLETFTLGLNQLEVVVNPTTA